MGFIPIFITMGGACLLFFLTVRNTMQRKLNRHHELIQELKTRKELSILLEKSDSLNAFFSKIKAEKATLNINKKELDVIRELKFNRLKFNELIKKAPYNWVSKISRFQSIS